MFGQPSRWPLMLSPTGLTRMFHGHAELAVARAAARHGLLYSLSTMGTTRLEDLAQAFAGPKVFQIYIFKDRGLTAEFVARCQDAGFHGLALTVDTPVAGNRERDRRQRPVAAAQADAQVACSALRATPPGRCPR